MERQGFGIRLGALLIDMVILLLLGLMQDGPDNTHTRTTSRKPTVRQSRTQHRGVSRRAQRIFVFRTRQ